MPFTMDLELAAALAAATGDAVVPTAPRGDALVLRALTDATLGFTNAAEPDAVGVVSHDHTITLGDGSSLLARWYTPEEALPGSGVVYFHGGGMVCGSVELYDRLVAKYVQHTGVPFLSVDYRVAPEASGTTLTDDGFTALGWFVDRAAEFGVDPVRIAVMGDSAGGGVAAGVAIAARDAGVPLAKQILIYPMLDDRNITPDPAIAPFATWSYDDNYTGWSALLGADLCGPDVSPLAAPARLSDFTGLAPAFLDVGELDIFRDESISYAQRLGLAGVSCELYVRAGAPHGFDRFAPQSQVSQRAWADVLRAVTTL